MGIALLDAATYERVGAIADPGYEGSLRAPAWSPDGSQVAWERLSEGGDQIAVADAVDGATAHEVPQPEGPGWQLPAWRADGLLVVAAQCCGGFSEPAATEPGEAAVVDPADGEVVATFPHPGFVVDQDLDPSGTWLLVTYDDGSRWSRSTPTASSARSARASAPRAGSAEPPQGPAASAITRSAMPNAFTAAGTPA